MTRRATTATGAPTQQPAALSSRFVGEELQLGAAVETTSQRQVQLPSVALHGRRSFILDSLAKLGKAKAGVCIGNGSNRVLRSRSRVHELDANRSRAVFNARAWATGPQSARTYCGVLYAMALPWLHLRNHPIFWPLNRIDTAENCA